MRNTQRTEIHRETQYRYVLFHFGNGIKGILTDWKKALVFVSYLAAAYLCWTRFCERVEYSAAFGVDALYNAALKMLLPPLAILGLLLLIMLLGTPIRAISVGNSMRRIGLINHAGEIPILVKMSKIRQDHIVIMEFLANGIPIQEWENKRPNIGTALNVHVVKITEGKNRRRILLYTVPAKVGLPNMLYWKDEYLSNKDFVLILGESLIGRETVDISKTPHILLGGSTGSGKSILLKHLVMQCVKKRAIVYIADFKGGVDFSKKWRTFITLITEEAALLDILNALTAELERRKKLFASLDCANISEYNRRNYQRMQRIIFACDEVAEILDKTGRDKAGKERIAAYENGLATIARLGRAFGIHLILSTQRPDANILAGQIRNNMDCRICGRADNVLSQIILDNTAASDEIPKDAQGRFIMPDGTVFQGYLFDENSLSHREGAKNHGIQRL